MIEFAPFMLFILGLDPNNPGQVEFERIEVVYATLEACNQVGEATVEQRTKEASQISGASYEYRCIAVPKGEEIERAWREVIGESE